MNRKEIKIKYSTIGFSIGFILGVLLMGISNSKKTIKEEEGRGEEGEGYTFVWNTGEHLKLDEYNLYQELLNQELDFPEVVLAQALLETGYFKSACCTQKNNLFGIRSKSGGYMQFNHWTESVSAYKKYIQKYKQIPNDYYVYLVNMNYASDPNYINKLKQIKSNQIKFNNDKR